MPRNPNRELARKVIARDMAAGKTAEEIVDRIDPLLHDPRFGSAVEELAATVQQLADARKEIERLSAIVASAQTVLASVEARP